MQTELPIEDVRARLAWLAAHARLESVEEAATRFAMDRPSEPFAVAVKRRLADLRELYKLSAHLHRRR
jgi:hypothetical protein